MLLFLLIWQVFAFLSRRLRIPHCFPTGHGYCLNDTCICDPGFRSVIAKRLAGRCAGSALTLLYFPFSGLGYFIDRTILDCNVHDAGFLGVSCLPYAFSVITCLVALLRLKNLGRLRIFAVLGCNKHPKGVRKSKAPLQRACLTIMALCLCACMSFNTFALAQDHFTRNNMSVIVFWSFWANILSRHICPLLLGHLWEVLRTQLLGLVFDMHGLQLLPLCLRLAARTAHSKTRSSNFRPRYI